MFLAPGWSRVFRLPEEFGELVVVRAENLCHQAFMNPRLRRDRAVGHGSGFQVVTPFRFRGPSGRPGSGSGAAGAVLPRARTRGEELVEEVWLGPET